MCQHNHFYLIYVNVILETSAMKTLTTTLEGKLDQPVPRWIEPNVCHYFINRFELVSCVTLKVLALVNIFDIAFRVMFKLEAKCGYYIIHWMWCIVSGGLKNEWNGVCLL